MNMQGSVVAITGGSRGFGLEIARQLISLGAKVGLIGRTQDSLAKAAAELGDDNVVCVAGDVGTDGVVAAALSSIAEYFGRFDALINNAGLARPAAIDSILSTDLRLQIDSNFIGTVLASQAAIPLLKDAPNPRIVNISSASAWHYVEMSHLSVYAATKAAVERFTRDLREELQTRNIGVSCVRPGGAWTTFADSWDDEALRESLEAWHESGPHMDVGMEALQVAKAAVFCLTQPPGTAVDLLELRPNKRAPKLGEP